MGIENPDDLDRIDQEIRINELKEQANELVGREMTHWESPDCPPEIAEQFWKNVIEYEKAPLTTHFDQLAEQGQAPPAPDELTDEQISDRLWKLIQNLAARRIFMDRTNHLSDRELYEYLWSRGLREKVPDMHMGSSGAWHLGAARQRQRRR
ncbi:MAG TPA: hypothetical protein VGM03_04600 [Phycisphaerae bacterium]|jgi:hypothetical protein